MKISIELYISIYNILRRSSLQVESETPSDILSPFQVAEETNNDENASHEDHPNVQDTQRLLELFAVFHFVLQG